MLPLAGCIAKAPGSGGGGGNPKTVVTVLPATATVSGANTQKFTATVTGPPNTNVVWNLNGTAGNNTMTSAGMLDQTGLYTAPPSVPTPNTASITASAVADNTLSNTATVTITAPNVQVSVLPTTANITVGGTQTFTATVTGTTNVAVGWYVNSILNGNSTYGTITATSTATGSTAVYTAPQTAPQNTTVTITAQSVAISTVNATANVTVTPIVVTISPVTPPNLLLPVDGQQQFSATVTGTTNTAVNWLVNNIPGGDAINGTIDATGLYTAPSLIPSSVQSGPFQATITAQSQQNSIYSASALVNVHVTVTISPVTDTIGQGANLLYTATVKGTSNQGVFWSVQSATTGAFVPAADVPWLPSNEGIYIAPPLTQGTTTLSATINAQAQVDSESAAGTSTTVTVVQTDPLGTVSNVKTLSSSSCPAAPDGTLSNGTCFSMTVSCDGVADWTSYLKVNAPSGTPSGTVLFGVGEGGANLYDTEYTSGSTTVGGVLSKGYTTVQISFGAPFDNGANPNGWLTGPGGVRRLACRYATLANWVFNNPQTINSKATTSAPFCATGNAEGAGAIGYAVSEYGLNSIFKMIELTSGPVMTELDEGCSCSNGGVGPPNPPCNTTGPGTPLCFTSGMTTIDAAYSQPALCSSGNISNNLLLRSDSILYQRGKGAVFPLPTTVLNMRFGLLDTGGDEPQGWAWNKSVSQNNPTAQCENTASRNLPNDATSASDIVTDITGSCK